MVPLKSGVGVIAYNKQEFGCLIFPKGGGHSFGQKEGGSLNGD